MILYEPSHPAGAASLFVSGREKDDIARELDAFVHHFTLQRKHRDEISREHSLVVDCPAAIDVTVTHNAAEWIT